MLYRGGRFVVRLRPQVVHRHGLRSSQTNKEQIASLASDLQWAGSSKFASVGLRSLFVAARKYADTPVSRPKAHTGRTSTGSRAAKKSTTSGKTTTTTKKAPPKKATSTKKVVKKKPAKKPAKKAKKPKKAKAKPKPKARKVLTDEQKAAKAAAKVRLQTSQLKKVALLDTPRALPATAWMVYCAEQLKKRPAGQLLGESVKQTSVNYKNLSPADREQYNHIANENKAHNNREYRKFVTSHSPTQIKDANIARRALSRKTGQKPGSKKFSLLRDERLVLRPVTAYILFTKARFASGDLKGLKVQETGKLIASEWKALSAAEKQPYIDQGNNDKARYAQEAATVYKAT